MNCAEAVSHFTCLSVLQTQTQFSTLPLVPDKNPTLLLVAMLQSLSLSGSKLCLLLNNPERHSAQGNHSLPLRLVVHARSSTAMDGSGLREAKGPGATGSFSLSRIGGTASIGANGQKQGARTRLPVSAPAKSACQDARHPGGTRRLTQPRNPPGFSSVVSISRRSKARTRFGSQEALLSMSILLR